jgi:diaminopimelate decarboxylase
LPGIKPQGLALHIGSQILSMAPFRAAYARAAQLIRTLRASGQSVTRMDCGGGLGILYADEPQASATAFAGVLRQEFGGMGLTLMTEPGRWLVGNAGLLLSSVTLTKAEGRFTVLDAAMNDLVRPAMYEAFHAIVPVGPGNNGPLMPTDIVGPVCETGDTFARARPMPALKSNDRVAILEAGAYGAVMSSTYNSRPLAAIAMVDGANWATIRARQSIESLWAGEIMPDFLG